MSVQINSWIKFKLTVDGTTTIQEKRLVETGSKIVPTNLGPYHGVYKDEPEVPTSRDQISNRTIVGAKLLGMLQGEKKSFHHNGKSFEIEVLHIHREKDAVLPNNVLELYRDWLSHNCERCGRADHCKYRKMAYDQTLMTNKIMNGTLHKQCSHLVV